MEVGVGVGVALSSAISSPIRGLRSIEPVWFVVLLLCKSLRPAWSRTRQFRRKEGSVDTHDAARARGQRRGGQRHEEEEEGEKYRL